MLIFGYLGPQAMQTKWTQRVAYICIDVYVYRLFKTTTYALCQDVNKEKYTLSVNIVVWIYTFKMFTAYYDFNWKKNRNLIEFAVKVLAIKNVAHIEKCQVRFDQPHPSKKRNHEKFHWRQAM